MFWFVVKQSMFTHKALCLKTAVSSTNTSILTLLQSWLMAKMANRKVFFAILLLLLELANGSNIH